MQSILFLTPKDGGEIDRLVNLDHLATAWRDPEDGSTNLIVEGAQIKMGMKFEDFLAKVQELIRDNYISSEKSYAAWHAKRMADTEKIMTNVMRGGGHSHE